MKYIQWKTKKKNHSGIEIFKISILWNSICKRTLLK